MEKLTFGDLCGDPGQLWLRRDGTGYHAFEHSGIASRRQDGIQREKPAK
ncbi:MAG: hypothetical protein RL033_367 [Pseudomonadota bacterium]|jgi:hypothetical protein